MSKGLSSYPEHKRKAVALRRLKQNARGNGYWAAKDYAEKTGMLKDTTVLSMLMKPSKKKEVETTDDEAIE